jgi:hypothetical protein
LAPLGHRSCRWHSHREFKSEVGDAVIWNAIIWHTVLWGEAVWGEVIWDDASWGATKQNDWRGNRDVQGKVR